MKGKISSGLFGFILICFFLPWFSVSCNNQKILTFSGTDLAGLTKVEMPSFDMLGKNKSNADKATNPLAVLLLLITFIGIVAGVTSSKSGHTVSLSSGGISFVLLLLLHVSLGNDLKKETQGALQLSTEMGYWMLLLTYIGIGITNITALTSDNTHSLKILAGGNINMDMHRVVTPAAAFCPECGSKNESVGSFCEECGTRL